MKQTLLPEWTGVDAVILAWPNEDTDWAPWLDVVHATYLAIISVVNANQAGVILLCREQDISHIKSVLPDNAMVLLVPTTYNDTWVRDYGFLTVGDGDDNRQPVEFAFNGWGQKFTATQDNQVNQNSLAVLCNFPLRSSPVVVEGGALEIDQHGHLLTTASCLFNPLRNGQLSQPDYESVFQEMLGCNKVTVLQHGHLEGDDTDGHIDTLVRFTPEGGLVIQAAQNRPEDSHFAGLQALTDECAELLPDHQQYLLPLPEIYNDAGDRLPASYANFLICNRTILLPVYEQPEDGEAIAVMQQAYPHHQIAPINCAPLVQQFGSLHCISMQVPCNTLRQNVLDQLSQGVTVYV